ncbi:MAG: LLM class flavin-dependent oxidoreductase [Micromonosporaceae bacterium]
MRLGISWVPDDLGGYRELARRTEEIGIDRIGVPDTQASQYRECYVTLTHMFASTERVEGGPVVSNPLTRHPAVSAAAIASADELSGGRGFISLATGDTGVFNLGMRPAKLAQLEEYALVLRDLFDTGRAWYQGSDIRLKWVRRKVPIYLAADGPKALRLAGKVADGAIVGAGFTEEMVPLVQQYLREGAEQSGRSLDDLDVWYMSRAAVADRREDALKLVLPSLAAASAHAFRFSLQGKAVPEEHAEAVLELERRYDLTVHNQPGEDNPNGRLVEELGLTEYLADRMAVVGTEQDCVDKFRRLRKLGVHNVIMRPLVLDRYDFLDRWQRVIAAVRAT